MPEWHKYSSGLKNMMLAQGVKIDPVVTGDAARVLRIPGTTNRKLGKTPVVAELMPLPAMKLYDFPTTFAHLIPLAAPPPATKAAYNPFYSDSDWGGVKQPAGAFAELKGLPDDLSAGVEKKEEYLVPIAPIFEQCGFYKEALANKGKNNNEAQWHLAILGTTFMENGRAVAHAISEGYSTYIEAETDEKYDLKLATRQARGIGYPSCATIKGAGGKSCATCPLLAKGKSPLNIRPAVTDTVKNTSSPSGSSGQANWTGQSGISFANIPHRKWLYGFDLVRGELTVIGSPGGAGKSSLAIGMAICAATGRELLGEKIRGGSNLKALIINAEDSTVELRRRTHAFCLAHNVAARDLNGLTVVGADDLRVQQISFLRTNEKAMSALNQDGLDALQLALDELRPDVIVLDPLVSFCAGGNMNDNAVMSSVMRKLKEIAARYECAVLIVHHTRKGGDAGNVETISGAAAITNLARRAIMPAPLTDDDVKRLTILPSERFQYFKLVDAKSNLAPRATDSPLYRLQSVELPNPEPPLYPHGDNVQAITRVTLPIQPSGVASADDMKIELAIQEVVYRGKEIDGQAYPYSPSLAGASNQRALMPDALAAVANATAPRHWAPGDLEATIKTAINKMQADGRLVVEDMEDLVPKPGRFRRARGLKAVPI
jgi:AAA domain